MYLRKILEEHNYDTVGNFLDFYDSFKKSGCNNVMDFFRLYNPPITAKHHTCVGLSMELWNRLSVHLDKKYPDIGKHICVVSCEEDIGNTNIYTDQSRRLEALHNLEKEHSLMCLKVEFSGRQATLLCDPGYHVSRVVIIMADRAYPHTGWFITAEDNNILKEYNYHISPLNSNFVEWNERTTRNGKTETFTGLIYVGRPYLTAIDVTERRNIVYNFRSLLKRDQKGSLIAGIYFKVVNNLDDFTIFFQDMGKQRVKIPFSAFMKSEIDKDLLRQVAICNEQLSLPEGRLLNIIKKSKQILNDTSFLSQLLDINACINNASANN